MTWANKEPVSRNRELFRLSAEVGADLSAARGKAVKMTSTNGQVTVVTAVTDECIGVFDGDTEGVSGSNTATSEAQISVLVNPVGQDVELLCNGATVAISRGTLLTHNASGVWVAANGLRGGKFYAIARASCSAANERIVATWVGKQSMSLLREHVKTVTYADLAEADTSQTVNIATGDDGTAFPTNVVRAFAVVEYDTAFSGTGLTGLTVEVGDAGDIDELVDGLELVSGSPSTGLMASGPATDARLWNFETAYAPIATFTETGANGNAITVGQLKVRIFYIPVSVID